MPHSPQDICKGVIDGRVGTGIASIIGCTMSLGGDYKDTVGDRSRKLAVCSGLQTRLRVD